MYADKIEAKKKEYPVKLILAEMEHLLFHHNWNENAMQMLGHRSIY